MENAKKKDGEFSKSFPLHVTKAIRKNVANLSSAEEKLIQQIEKADWTRDLFLLSEKKHINFAARAVSLGAVIAYGFGNFLALASHPHRTAVSYVNVTKGRPWNQVGSITTTRSHISDLFNWKKLPKEITKKTALNIIDDLYQLGPFGFRGPAGKKIPKHLRYTEDGVSVVQLITPGYRCPSNRLVEAILKIARIQFLFATSPNISHHITGSKQEAAHYKMRELQKDFSGKPGYIMVAHHDEIKNRQSYTKHQPTSTSILSLHKVVYDERGKRALVLERHGSLHAREVKKVLKKYGFNLVFSDAAKHRLEKRKYL